MVRERQTKTEGYTVDKDADKDGDRQRQTDDRRCRTKDRRQTDREERERDTCTVASFNVYFYYLNFNIWMPHLV